MTRVSFDIDPRVLSKLRALANRRGVTVDVVVGEFLGNAIRQSTKRTSGSSGSSDSSEVRSTGEVARRPDVVRQPFGLIDVEYPGSTEDDQPE